MKFNIRKILYMVRDLVLIIICYYMSFLIRFEGKLPLNFVDVYLLHLIPLLGIKMFFFVISNQYKRVWRYVNLHEIIKMIESLTICTVIFTGYVYFLRIPLPRSIIVLDWMLSIIFIGGINLLPRFLDEQHFALKSKKNTKKVLIVGAGDAGALVVKEFRKHWELKTQIVGFIDDDPLKQGLEIAGVKVLGNRVKIPAIVSRYAIDEIIIAMPSVKSKEIRDIHSLCTKSGANIRILPGVYEIINGDVYLSQIREVQVEDLLGREPVEIDMEKVAKYLTNKTVLVTGGGGSIGSELCRQVTKFNPKRIVIFDISENNLYDIDLELKKNISYFPIIPVVGSVRDKERLRSVFAKYRPEVVFHAAAHKHVPMMEYNPEEAVKNNILGTKNVAEVADEFGVERFVMISTDKAVNPTNIMGATKRVAEMIIQDLNKISQTKFVAVRFGNVLGSQGSVIPLFKKQIMQGGPVTVTHPDITRYFMTIPEACQLVMQAGALGQGGEVFVLDMGKPVKIIDLARDLIELSGFKAGEDIDIQITGLRPGEKLYEELLSDKEGMLATQHERILVAQLEGVESDLLKKILQQLEQKNAANLQNFVVSTLVKLVASYKPSTMHDVGQIAKEEIS